MARFAVGVSFVLSISLLVLAQNSDQQALTYAAQSIQALTGGNKLYDVTLSGTAQWTIGDNSDSGPASFLALGSGESRMDLQLSAGTRSEIRDASTGSPLGEWLLSGNGSQFAYQNCWTDAVWFFPAFSSLAVAPYNNVVLLYLGATTWQGANVQHLQSYIYLSGQPQNTITYVEGLSPVDYYLDATSLLLVGMTFNAYPDNASASSIPVQIVFSNYQSVSGVLVPLHVQKYFNGNLLLDASITSASFNSGLPLSDFSIQ